MSRRHLTPVDSGYVSPGKLLSEPDARKIHTAVIEEAKAERDPLHELITELATASQALQAASKFAMVLMSERLAQGLDE